MRYGEHVVVPTKNAQTTIELIETSWIYHLGALKNFSSDPEFCKTVLERFMTAHGIEVDHNPLKIYSKNGMVELNSGVSKTILTRLEKERTTASPHTLVCRAYFLTNLFHGNKTLSAFQLTRDYSPSILGVPGSVVPQDLPHAHVHGTAARALQKR